MSMETVNRPWGYYIVMCNDLSELRGQKYQVKKLVIKPEQRISLQSHDHRDEYWTILQGTGLLVKGDFTNGLAKEYLSPGRQLYIPKRQVHRATNTSKLEDLIILEAQMGNLIDEKDIVRYDNNLDKDLPNGGL